VSFNDALNTKLPSYSPTFQLCAHPTLHLIVDKITSVSVKSVVSDFPGDNLSLVRLVTNPKDGCMSHICILIDASFRSLTY